MTTSQTVNYSDLVNQLKTGDLLLFHGSSGISRHIEEVTRGEFSHAAMVVRPHPDQPPLIWQTGPDPLKEDVLTKSMHGGAQLSDFLSTVTLESSPQYGDVPYWRQLTVTRNDAFETMALGALGSLDGTPFGTYWDMARNWALGKIHFVTTPNEVFCAELVAMTYMRMGLLPMSPPPNSYSPSHFGGDVALLGGATLGPAIQVNMSASARAAGA